MSRAPVRKTYKLFIGGAFPRSESGRTLELEGHNVARASRKDARDAVVAARNGLAVWSTATAYNRGQVLYRLAETMETRTASLAAVCSGRREVARAIDRVVWYAGWADKLAQVLGSSNPVAGPYFNFTVPEPTDERRDVRRAGLGREQRLRRREAQRDVGLDALVCARANGLEAFGEQRDLDDDVRAQRSELARFLHHLVVLDADNFRRHRTFHDVADLEQHIAELAPGLCNQ